MWWKLGGLALLGWLMWLTVRDSSWFSRRSSPPQDIPTPSDEDLRILVGMIPKDDDVDRQRFLLDLLDDACKFSASKRMIDDEFREIWRLVIADRNVGQIDPADVGKSERQLKAEFRAIADRRVRLGLVLGAIGRRNNITFDEYPWGASGEAKENKIVEFIFALAEK
jgi:hypothetical protein